MTLKTPKRTFSNVKEVVIIFCLISQEEIQIEQNIASKNNKLDNHYKKWNKVLPCFTLIIDSFFLCDRKC